MLVVGVGEQRVLREASRGRLADLLGRPSPSPSTERTLPTLQQVEPARFAIADISGYTRFLDAVELDHAHDVIADLLGAVTKALRPPAAASLTALAPIP